MKITPLSSKQQGFTIVELMIATLVFSVILLVITYGVLSFTNGYYRSINASSTQVAVQGAVSSISQAVQFTSNQTVSTDGTQGFFCAGNKHYVYTLGKQFDGSPTTTDAGLYEMSRTGANCAAGRNPATTPGTELLGEKMRLLAINVTQVASPPGSAPVWTISLRIAYGDSELLCDGNIPGACASDSTTFYAAGSNVSGSNINCMPTKGSQYCSIAAASTVALQRIVM